jgi:hypothetical protein
MILPKKIITIVFLKITMHHSKNYINHKNNFNSNKLTCEHQP